MEKKDIEGLHKMGFMFHRNRTRGRIVYVSWTMDIAERSQFKLNFGKVIKLLNKNGWEKMTEITPWKWSFKKIGE